MTAHGMIIVFSGALGSGSSDLSRLVADRLGWPRVKFSDYIRIVARARGEDASDRGVLQRIGQELVQTQRGDFVREVLAAVEWRAAGCLVVDGLRHAEIRAELETQTEQLSALRVVHIDMAETARRERARRLDGLNYEAFSIYDRDLTEAQLERILPQYADLRLDGSRSHEELADRVLRHFAPSDPARATDDRGEDVSKMEPLLIADGKHRDRLADLALALTNNSRSLALELPAGVRVPLADLIRTMNCYYSNLIEGHDTHPVDIERAMRNDYSTDVHKRNLQHEARAHIAVQGWIDGGGLGGRSPTTEEIVREIHRRFCSDLPSDLLWAINEDTGERWRVAPGAYREHDVRVGRHVPPSPGAVRRFMRRFAEVYAPLRGVDRVVSAATAHHRLAWIHPFTDGNGRVARLMSHAILLEALDTQGIWSVARGLARRLGDYKVHLAAADLRRRNDLDGRGSLSEETLAEFAAFFLDTCLDQVAFMRRLFEAGRIRRRVLDWANEEIALNRLRPNARGFLDLLVSTPEVSEADAHTALEGADVEAVMRTLQVSGVLKRAASVHRFSFPVTLSERFLPGLWPLA